MRLKLGRIWEWTISLLYTPTTLHIANIINKVLSKTNFEDLQSNLRIMDIYNPT